VLELVRRPRRRPGEHARFDVPEEDRAHYSAGTIDVEYRFGFPGKEWGELMGVANRTDYDLKSHSDASGQSLTFFDQASGEKYTPSSSSRPSASPAR
jgi:glycyl-tRNA synthetase